jgi:1-acyl-sn-glycerol-3-phosphate acyltransferase
MRPFKLGAFRLAIESGVDILPLIIRGTRNAVPKHSLRLTRKSKMSVEILPAISTKGFDLNRLSDEAKRLADYVYDQMQSALGQGQAIAIPA